MEHVGVQFRSYRAEDLAAMYALDVVCFEAPFRFTRGAMRRFAAGKRARVIVAEERDVLVGFVIMNVEESKHGSVGYVVTLDVDPAFRGRGIARSLMEQAEAQARGADCAAMMLHVFTGNDAALKFYARLGFVRAHREEGFYGAGMDAWFCHKVIVR